MAAPSHITDEQIEELGLSIREEVKSKTAIVRPGDTILVGFEFELTAEQYEELSRFCKTLLPGVNVMAFPGVHTLRVFRPKDPEDM